jgi:hypothetical protein
LLPVMVGPTGSSQHLARHDPLSSASLSPGSAMNAEALDPRVPARAFSQCSPRPDPKVDADEALPASGPDLRHCCISRRVTRNTVQDVDDSIYSCLNFNISRTFLCPSFCCVYCTFLPNTSLIRVDPIVHHAVHCLHVVRFGTR